MRRVVVVLMALAAAGCAGANSLAGDYGYGPGYGGYGAPPPYYGGAGYYGAPGYGYGWDGPRRDWDGDRDRWHGGDYGAVQRQQALTAQQQLYNQRITGAEQRYNQQLSANPQAAPALRNQLAAQGQAARHQLEQDTRGVR